MGDVNRKWNAGQKLIKKNKGWLKNEIVLPTETVKIKMRMINAYVSSTLLHGWRDKETFGSHVVLA